MKSQYPNVDCATKMIQKTRERIGSAEFKNQYRLNRRCFSRERLLPFNCVLMFILQKTVRSIQLHLHDFFQQLGGQEWGQSVTAGGWTQARAKLQAEAFLALNQEAVLETVYGERTDFVVQRWRDWRVVAIDSSLMRLPPEELLGQEFGWVECANQLGPCGRYVQARLSSLYDVLNHLALEVRLVPWQIGERELAVAHLAQVAERDLLLTDRGYASYEWWARQLQAHRQFVCRCEANTFGVVRELLAANIAGRSMEVSLNPPAGREDEMDAAGLPEAIVVRFVTLRLPSGELEVLATSLLDEQAYPTACFYEVYGYRWGVETFYDVLKGRLDLENFSGRTLTAIRQDVYSTVFLSNLETVLTRRTQQRLEAQNGDRKYPAQVNRAVSFHAIKSHLLALLWSAQPTPKVLQKLEQLFLQKPTRVRKRRQVPRKKRSGWRSYYFQRNCKKVVF